MGCGSSQASTNSSQGSTGQPIKQFSVSYSADLEQAAVFVQAVLEKEYPGVSVRKQLQKDKKGLFEVFADQTIVHSKEKGEGVVTEINKAAFLEVVRRVNMPKDKNQWGGS